MRMAIPVLFLAAFCTTMFAQEWQELRLRINNDVSAPVVAGTSLQLSLACSLAAVDETGETVAPYNGSVLIWYKQWAVAGNGLPWPEPVSLELLVIDGVASFDWCPEVAGLQFLTATIPAPSEVLPGYSNSVVVVAAAPVSARGTTFENGLNMVPIDGGELAEHVSTGFGGSVWVSIEFLDSFGNVCQFLDASGASLDIACTVDPENVAEQWGMSFTTALVSDDGFDAIDGVGPIDGGVEPLDEDQDAIGNALKRVARGSMQLLGTIAPRRHTRVIHLRLIGSSSTPLPGTSVTFGVLLTISGNVAGISFSGAVTIPGGATTLIAAAVPQPYLVLKSKLDDPDYGRDIFYPVWKDPNGALRVRAAGCAAWQTLNQNCDLIDKGFTNPGVLGVGFESRLTNTLKFAAGYSKFEGMPIIGVPLGDFHSEGSPSVYGHFNMAVSTLSHTVAELSMAGQDRYARRGWKYEVAFPAIPGVQQNPQHVFGGRFRRHYAAYAQAVKSGGALSHARAQVAWTLRAWGSGHNTPGESSHKISAHDGTNFTINGASVGFPPSLSVNIEATAVGPKSAKIDYATANFDINTSSLVMSAGFSIGYSAEASITWNDAACSLGFLDFLRVATNVPDINAGGWCITIAQADASAYSYVAVGCSGAAGIEWTSAEWLR